MSEYLCISLCEMVVIRIQRWIGLGFLRSKSARIYEWVTTLALELFPIIWLWDCHIFLFWANTELLSTYLCASHDFNASSVCLSVIDRRVAIRLDPALYVCVMMACIYMERVQVAAIFEHQVQNWKQKKIWFEAIYTEFMSTGGT